MLWHKYCSLLPNSTFLYTTFQPPSSDAVPELNSPPVLTAAGGVMSILAEVTHAPPGLPLPPQYNIAEYMGQHVWPANIIVAPINQPLEVHFANSIHINDADTHNSKLPIKPTITKKIYLRQEVS